MTLSERFKQARLKAGLSQDDVAKAVKISQPAIRKIESGETKHPSRILAIAKALKVNAEWLLDGAESLHDSPTSANVNRAAAHPDTDITWQIPALRWDQLINYTEGNLSMDDIKEYQTVVDSSHSKCVSLIVQNDEMTTSDTENSFRRGEHIIIDLNFEHKINDFVIARFKNTDKLIFKQYIEYAEKYYLKSLNPQYPLIEITDDIQIVGVVVAAHTIRKFKH